MAEQSEIVKQLLALLPLAVVAILVWVGVFAFVFNVDRKIADIEKRIADKQSGRGENSGEDR